MLLPCLGSLFILPFSPTWVMKMATVGQFSIDLRMQHLSSSVSKQEQTILRTLSWAVATLF
jgi:hypothetical protein